MTIPIDPEDRPLAALVIVTTWAVVAALGYGMARGLGALWRVLTVTPWAW